MEHFQRVNDDLITLINGPKRPKSGESNPVGLHLGKFQIRVM